VKLTPLSDAKLRYLCLVVFVFFWAVPAHGQTGKQFSDSQPLASRDFTLSTDSEVGLEITARSPGASWAKKGAEAAALLIEVDGHYNQDLLLWAGNAPFKYKVMLGRLTTGKHRVTARLNQPRCAFGSQRATVLSLRALPLARDSQHTADDLMALAYSPVLHQRANTIDRFSDVPILMYYEVSHLADRVVQVRYTTIFTNEDGGTATAALMARWGRAADIEWVYEFRARDGKIIEETYQGISHETKPFEGQRINGVHPLLADASDNNNFSDQLTTTVRFALLPIAVDLRDGTRERVMDSNPWTYRVVAEELLREGKLKSEPNDSKTISDPRNYLYVDLHARQNGAALSVEATSAKESGPSFSDLGEAKLRIDRGGYFRTAIRFGSPENAAFVSSLTIHCYSQTGSDCEEVEVKAAAVLTKDYNPRFLRVQRFPPRTIKANETITIAVQ
jgi:hypothetical protein